MIRARCEVLSNRMAGRYHSLTLVAPDIAEAAGPGQFVEIAVPSGRDITLRRPFSIHQASKRGGWAGTVEVVFDVHGQGTDWLAHIKAHEFVDVVGPIGRPFRYPKEQTSCLLVGGGYGAAPLYFLAEELRARNKDVNMIIGARSHDRVFKPIEGKRLASSIVMTTEDGSMGEAGRVTDVLPVMLSRTRAQVVYACGPNAMLRAVAEYCLAQGVPCQVAVEEMMACGIGVCWTCVVPVIALDGQGWWNVRACQEGPVFNGARVWWDRWLGETPSAPTTPAEGFPSVTEEAPVEA
ncbi:MAG TPA: dihydroorotate dehydrogenase electron transfer subunit [Actinobacteria bacterium]|jgi:dihydroorotate dehydrogenase electron transfer subunit|nr:dihydroorotate dehydrogenase electron transfer subunit [Actinomycetota bacterium]HCP62182.1 dihydroorotate dehydrogenase electron transfer subunit [Actinomycetota bacterium]